MSREICDRQMHWWVRREALIYLFFCHFLSTLTHVTASWRLSSTLYSHLQWVISSNTRPLVFNQVLRGHLSCLNNIPTFHVLSMWSTLLYSYIYIYIYIFYTLVTWTCNGENICSLWLKISLHKLVLLTFLETVVSSVLLFSFLIWLD